MRISTKIITNKYLSWIVFFVLMIPPYFKQNAYIYRTFRILHLLLFCILFVLYIGSNKIKKGNISKVVIFLVIYYLYYVFITVINNGNLTSTITQAIQFCSFCIYLDMIIVRDTKLLFQSCLNILKLYVIINLITVILFPEGIYSSNYFNNNFFLGYDNQNINFILPLMVLVLVDVLIRRKSIFSLLFVYTISIITALRIWSAMTLVVVFVMSFFAFICLKKKNYLIDKFLNGNWFNAITLLITNIVLSYSIVVFRIYYIFEKLITEVLEKSMTLTGRTKIWDRAMIFVENNPIWGYGEEINNVRALKMGYILNHPAGLHAHNRFLEVLYCGGIILFVIYLILLFISAFKLYKFRHERIAKVIAVSIFIYMTGMITEFYDYCFFFWGLLLMGERIEFFVIRNKNGG